jgi:hypothetical protein
VPAEAYIIYTMAATMQGRRYDTSPIGPGPNWVTKTAPVEGLGSFVRAVVHALIRDGHPEQEAVQIALGVMKRWAKGIGTGGPHNKSGHVTAQTQAKAAAAVAHWEEIKARAHLHSGDNRSGVRQVVTETGSSAAALIPKGVPPAQAKKVNRQMGANPAIDFDPHAFRGLDLEHCAICGQPINAAVHQARGAAQAVPPVPRQARLVTTRLGGGRGAIHELLRSAQEDNAAYQEGRADCRAGRSRQSAQEYARRHPHADADDYPFYQAGYADSDNLKLVPEGARALLRHAGVRWVFNPMQPRIHGKWSGPSAEVQAKAKAAYVKLHEGSGELAELKSAPAWHTPELHAFIKGHVDAKPSITAAEVKQKLIAAGMHSTYKHILPIVTELKKQHGIQPKTLTVKPKLGPPKVPEPEVPHPTAPVPLPEAKPTPEVPKPAFVQKSDIELASMSKSALIAHHLAAGLALGHAHPYTQKVGSFLNAVEGHGTKEPVPEPASPPVKVGFNGTGHVGFGGTEALGLQADSSESAMKWFKPDDQVYAYIFGGNKLVQGTVDHTQKTEEGGVVHVKIGEGEKAGTVQRFNATRVAHKDVIDSLDSHALQLHAEASEFAGVKAAFNAAAKLHEPAPPSAPLSFLAKTDAELAQMSKSELQKEYSNALVHLGANHPYVDKVLGLYNAKGPDIEPPTPSKWAPGSLEERVEYYLGKYPNATSARLRQLLEAEGHPDTNYRHILAAVKRVKAANAPTPSAGPVATGPSGALVPEEAFLPNMWGKPAVELDPAAEAVGKLKNAFEANGSIYADSTRRAAKRRICADLAKRLYAKTGTAHDDRLLGLCLSSYTSPSQVKGVKLLANGTLDTDTYPTYGPPAAGYQPIGSPKGKDIIRKAGISQIIGLWANTSNDHNAKSLCMQDAIKSELGVHAATEWASATPETKAQVAALMQDGTYDTYKAVARCMYEATQEHLKSLGITKVRLYRGVKLHGEAATTAAGGYADLVRAKSSYGQDKVADVGLRPGSSWSYDKVTARRFATSLGAVMVATVPVDRVLGSALTGFGCLNEMEVVVLGGKDKVLVT